MPPRQLHHSLSKQKMKSIKSRQLHISILIYCNACEQHLNECGYSHLNILYDHVSESCMFGFPSWLCSACMYFFSLSSLPMQSHTLPDTSMVKSHLDHVGLVFNEIKDYNQATLKIHHVSLLTLWKVPLGLCHDAKMLALLSYSYLQSRIYNCKTSRSCMCVL